MKNKLYQWGSVHNSPGNDKVLLVTPDCNNLIITTDTDMRPGQRLMFKEMSGDPSKLPVTIKINGHTIVLDEPYQTKRRDVYYEPTKT